MPDIFVKDGEGIQRLCRQFADDLRVELDARWKAWSLDLEKQEVHEAVGALLGRQVTLAREIAEAPATWNWHIAPVLLRAMADVHITLAWMLEAPTERARKFILYGLGQLKLQLEHRKAALEEEGADREEIQAAIQATEAWINEQRFTFLTDVNLGSWSETTTRKMAEEAGCLDFYNYVYQEFSAGTHSAWHHVGRYNLKECQNPLHGYHRVPADPDLPRDLWILQLAGKYVAKSFDLFDTKTGVTLAGPSAVEKLYSGLADLAKAAQAHEPD
jgi:Family of unknown function (DUF5677)